MPGFASPDTRFRAEWSLSLANMEAAGVRGCESIERNAAAGVFGDP
jgi:hypothetical protein